MSAEIYLTSDCMSRIFDFADLPTMISIGHVNRALYVYANISIDVVCSIMKSNLFNTDHCALFDWLWAYGYCLSPAALTQLHCLTCARGNSAMIWHLLKYRPRNTIMFNSNISFWGRQCENIRFSHLDRVIQDEIIARFHALGCKCSLYTGDSTSYSNYYAEKFDITSDSVYDMTSMCSIPCVSLRNNYSTSDNEGSLCAFSDTPISAPIYASWSDSYDTSEDILDDRDFVSSNE